MANPTLQNPQATIPRFPRARIAVFAREPVLGQVKTRLIPELGAESALQLYTAMIQRTLDLVQQSCLAEMALWVSSNKHHKLFASNCNKKEIYIQSGDDLGRKMYHCASTMLDQAGVESLLIIGTDCPALTREYLEEALTALADGQDIVVGPAEDGGYVLLGLRRANARLFEGIDWGSESVLSATQDRIAEQSLSLYRLPVLWDVDTACDVARLRTLPLPLNWSV